MNYSNPLVYVLIPNRNGIIHLSYSLKALADTTYINHKVVLVDDRSTDESVSYVRSNYSAISVIHNSGKRGFAGGVNTGIKYALQHGASHIAIFNSDIKVIPQWIELALDGFKQERMVGMVGFMEVLKEHEDQFYGTEVTRDTIIFKERMAIAGCLYICASDMFRTIGYLDEDYFMYGEDNDLLYRARKAGFKILESNIPVWHFGEGSSGKNNFLPTWLAYRNALRFSLKNESPIRIMRMLLSLINQGCNVFLKEKMNDPSAKRLRRFNPFVNLILIIGSVCWNIVNIIPTLRARKSTYLER